MTTPHVITYSIASVDGRLTIAPDVVLLYGDERWGAVAGSSSELYKRVKRTFNPQVILEGSGSFVSEDTEPEPLPHYAGDHESLYQDYLPDTVVNRAGHQGWFTAVDSRGRVRGWIKEWPDEEWAGWHTLVLVSHQTPPEYLDYLQRENIPYLVAGETRVDLSLAIERLGSVLGVERVLSTAGGKLNGALLRAGLIDEINIEFFPAVIGGFTTPKLFDSPHLEPQEWPTRLRLISAQVLNEDRVWLRYEVVREES